MISRLPDNLPTVLAMAAGGAVAGNGYASLLAEQAWGRPSSTSALGYLFIPVAAVVASVLAFLFGLYARWLVVAGDVRSRSGPAVALLSLTAIALASGGGAARGISSVRASEVQARPRVLVTSSEVRRSLQIPVGAHLSGHGSVLLAPSVTGTPSALPLPGGRGKIVLSGLSASFVFGQRTATVGLESLDYVTRVDAVEVPTGWLVVAVTGRATGRRLVVAILSADGRLHHAELFERCWSLDRPPLEQWVSSDGTTMAALPCGCHGAVVFWVGTGSPTRG